MKKLIYTTVYNDILGSIERLGLYDIDHTLVEQGRAYMLKHIITDKDGGKVEISLVNDKYIREMANKYLPSNINISKNQWAQIMRAILSKCLFFTSHDICIYRILLSHYINYQVNGVASISLDIIHLKYRNKDFLRKGNEKYDAQTLKVYTECIHKLKTLRLVIQFSNSNLKSFKSFIRNDVVFFNQPFIKIMNESITLEELKNGAEIEYSLGRFGDYLVQSRQYGQILPSEVFELRFNQINTLNIAIYLGKLVFINRKYKKTYKISVYTLLTRFNKYDKNGFSTSTSYMDYLIKLTPTKRTKKVQLINEQINYVLDLLVRDEKIFDYEYDNKFLFKYIKDNELMLTIQLKKNKGKG